MKEIAQPCCLLPCLLSSAQNFPPKLLFFLPRKAAQASRRACVRCNGRFFGADAGDDGGERVVAQGLPAPLHQLPHCLRLDALQACPLQPWRLPLPLPPCPGPRRGRYVHSLAPCPCDIVTSLMCACCSMKSLEMRLSSSDSRVRFGVDLVCDVGMSLCDTGSPAGTNSSISTTHPRCLMKCVIVMLMLCFCNPHCLCSRMLELLQPV